MIEIKLQYYFDDVVSFDDGETVETVKVGYDYYPEEINYPYDHNYAEMFDVFVFDAKGNHITYDIPNDEYKRLMQEAKADFYQIQKDRNEI
jgi:uncharacterized FlaG/YvyC family protein